MAELRPKPQSNGPIRHIALEISEALEATQITRDLANEFISSIDFQNNETANMPGRTLRTILNDLEVQHNVAPVGQRIMNLKEWVDYEFNI